MSTINLNDPLNLNDLPGSEWKASEDFVPFMVNLLYSFLKQWASLGIVGGICLLSLIHLPKTRECCPLFRLESKSNRSRC